MRTKRIKPTPKQLNENERAVMTFIEGYKPKFPRFSPTVREIAQAVGLSVSTIHALIGRLIGWGYLSWHRRDERHRKCSIRVKRSIANR